MTTVQPGSPTKPSDLSAPSSFRFSTFDLPVHERIPFCRDVLGRHLLNVEIDELSDAPFFHNSAFHTLPGLQVASVTSSAARGTRTRELIARDGAGEVVFTVSVRGALTITWPGHEMSGASGEAVLMPLDSPGSGGWPEEGSILFYRVPVKLLQPLVPNIGDSLYRLVPRATEALRLLVGYTGMMLGPEAAPTPELRRAAAAHLRDLIALALGATRDGTAMAEEGGLRAARLQAIKAEVTREAASPELSVGAIARRHNLSPRSIQMLFEAEGVTFSQFVLDQRLMLAHRALSSWQAHRRSITDIALDAGFSNVSYFNRAFRNRFGASPTEVRARHMN